MLSVPFNILLFLSHLADLSLLYSGNNYFFLLLDLVSAVREEQNDTNIGRHLSCIQRINKICISISFRCTTIIKRIKFTKITEKLLINENY